MSSSYLDLFMDKGASFNTAITLTDVNGNPINLSNIIVNSTMKRSYVTANVAATFTISVANNQSGLIQLSLPYQVTQNLKTIRYVYDVVMRDLTSNVVSRVLEGTCYVSAGVTVAP